MDLDEIEATLKELYEKRDAGDDEVPSAVKVNPKNEVENENEAENENKKLVKQNENINYVIYEMEDKKDKAIQNDKILLVNLWATVLFRCENSRVNNFFIVEKENVAVHELHQRRRLGFGRSRHPDCARERALRLGIRVQPSISGISEPVRDAEDLLRQEDEGIRGEKEERRRRKGGSQQKGK